MNIRKIYREFENLIVELLTIYNIINERNKFIGNEEVDIILKKGNQDQAFVEVKIYRSKKIHLSQIKRALQRLVFIINEGHVNHGLLVISSIIDNEIKESLKQKYGITIWDRSTLYQLFESYPELRERLESVLVELAEDDREDIFEGISTEDIDFEIGSIWKLRAKKANTYISNGRKLCDELNEIQAGKVDYKRFELKCEEILKYIFDTDLTAWHHQARTEDGLNQFDLICRITSSHDFWRSLSRNFNCRYMLFEFKNYRDKIKQGQVYTTEKYLFNKALRSVGFIIAKNGAEDNAIKAMKGALREHGKLLICLTPEDLCKMLDKKDKGDDPNSYLAEIVDDFLIKLSR